MTLDRAYEFILDMDTIYQSGDAKLIKQRFKTEILDKYDVDELSDLVELLFENDVPHRLVSPNSPDQHSLMRLCYQLRKNTKEGKKPKKKDMTH